MTDIENKIKDIIDRLEPNVWTYRYTREIIKLATLYDDIDTQELLSQLDNETENGNKRNITSTVTFTKYYLLAHYYRLFSKTDALIDLIQKYRYCFNTIPYNEEVNCWYYKRKGDWKEAYNRSKKLLNTYRINDNGGIYANFISTVLKMLEIEDNSQNSDTPIVFWQSDEDRLRDWNDCRRYSDFIIDSDPETVDERVGAQYAKSGQLLMYEPHLRDKDINTIITNFDSAVDFFEKAVTYSDEKSKNYNKRCMEYRQMQAKCYIRKIDFINSKNFQREEEQLRRLKETETAMKESIDNQLAKSLEIMSVFTAIITLVTTGVSIMKGIPFENAVCLILITADIWCLIYCVFVFLLYRGHRAVKSVIIAIIMIVLLYFMTKNVLLPLP